MRLKSLAKDLAGSVKEVMGAPTSVGWPKEISDGIISGDIQSMWRIQTGPKAVANRGTILESYFNRSAWFTGIYNHFLAKLDCA